MSGDRLGEGGVRCEAERRWVEAGMRCQAMKGRGEM